MPGSLATDDVRSRARRLGLALGALALLLLVGPILVMLWNDAPSR